MLFAVGKTKIVVGAHIYLRQGDYVFGSVGLFVCLCASSFCMRFFRPQSEKIVMHRNLPIESEFTV